MRRTIQFILIGPTFLAPVMWLFLLAGNAPYQEEMLREVFPDRTRMSVILPMAAAIGGTAIGLAALWMSVVIGRKKKSLRLRSVLVLGLAIGLALDCWMLSKFYSEPLGYPDWQVVTFLVWLLVGPLIVGSWNLFWLLRKTADKSAQTTAMMPPTSTTPPEPLSEL